jgi:hypothetical protein
MPASATASGGAAAAAGRLVATEERIAEIYRCNAAGLWAKLQEGLDVRGKEGLLEEFAAATRAVVSRAWYRMEADPDRLVCGCTMTRWLSERSEWCEQHLEGFEKAYLAGLRVAQQLTPPSSQATGGRKSNASAAAASKAASGGAAGKTAAGGRPAGAAAGQASAQSGSEQWWSRGRCHTVTSEEAISESDGGWKDDYDEDGDSYVGSDCA